MRGNLSRTVLETSGGGDKPAEFNQQQLRNSTDGYQERDNPSYALREVDT